MSFQYYKYITLSQGTSNVLLFEKYVLYNKNAVTLGAGGVVVKVHWLSAAAAAVSTVETNRHYRRVSRSPISKIKLRCVQSTAWIPLSDTKRFVTLSAKIVITAILSVQYLLKTLPVKHVSYTVKVGDCIK